MSRDVVLSNNPDVPPRNCWMVCLAHSVSVRKVLMKRIVVSTSDLVPGSDFVGSGMVTLFPTRIQSGGAMLYSFAVSGIFSKRSFCS